MLTVHSSFRLSHALWSDRQRLAKKQIKNWTSSSSRILGAKFGRALTHYYVQFSLIYSLFPLLFYDLLFPQVEAAKQLNRFQQRGLTSSNSSRRVPPSRLGHRPGMATSVDTLPAHLLPLVMEEFPQSLATACVCRAGQREPRLRCVQCGVIEEEEEDCSTLEEDQALRSFLRTVESLRRSTRWAPPPACLEQRPLMDFLTHQPGGDQQMSAVLWMQAALTLWAVKFFFFWWKLLGHLVRQWSWKTKYWSAFQNFFFKWHLENYVWIAMHILSVTLS